MEIRKPKIFPVAVSFHSPRADLRTISFGTDPVMPGRMLWLFTIVAALAACLTVIMPSPVFAAASARFVRLSYQSFNNSEWFQLNEIEIFADGASGQEQVPIQVILSGQKPYGAYGVDRLKDGLKRFNEDFVVNRPVAPFSLTLDMGAVISLNSIVHWNDGQYGAVSVRVEISTDGNGYTLYSDFTLTTIAGQPNPDTLTNLPAIHSVTGYVRLGSGAAVSGITVEISGKGNIYTNSTGFFSKTGLVPGSYMLTPKSSSYTFLPASRALILPPNSTDTVFTATPVQATYFVSGYVRTSSGTGVSGVGVAISGIGTVLTDQDGRFSRAGLAPGTYTLTPAKTGFTFTPATRFLTIGPDAGSENFTALQKTTVNSVTARHLKFRYLAFGDPTWFQLNEIEVHGREPGGLAIKFPIEGITCSRSPLLGYGTDKLTDGTKTFNGDFVVKNPGSLVEITLDLGADRIVERIEHWNDGQYGASSAEVMAALSAAAATFRFAGRYDSLALVAGTVNHDTLDFNSPVVLNEFTMSPGAVELHNTGSAQIDVSGWTLSMSGVEFTIPSATIQPGSFFVIREGTGPIEPGPGYVYSQKDFPWAPDSDGWCSLVTGAGAGADFARWGGSAQNPPDGTSFTGDNPDAPTDGESLSRAADGEDTDNGSDWRIGAPTMGSANGSTYIIAGIVSFGGSTLDSVNVNISTLRNVSSDFSGNFEVIGVPAGTYVITPSKAGYEFSPSSLTVMVGPSVEEIEFEAVSSPGIVTSFTFSGYVKDSEAQGVSSIKVLVNGGGSVRTDSAGRYLSSSLPPGIYRVGPQSSQYSFTPAYLDVAIGPSVTNRNFVASETFEIKGYVRNNLSTPLSGAEIRLNGVSSAYTDATGMYSKTGLASGEYTVIVVRAGYSFEPAEQIAEVPPSASGVNFSFTTSYLLSGFVRNAASVPMDGVTVEILFGDILLDTLETDASGHFEKAGLGPGNYSVIPDKDRFTFAPPSRRVTMGPSSTGLDFTGTEAFSMSGFVTTADGVPISGCSVEVAGLRSVRTDGAGFWRIEDLAAATYVVTPVKPLYVFTPASRTITLGPDVTGVAFDGNYVPSGKVLYVDRKFGADGADGTKEKPFPSITAALISLTTTGASVEVAAGFYFEKVIMKPGVTVRGEGPGVTFIDGSAVGSVVTMAENSTLVGFTVKGGGTGDTAAGVDFTKVGAHATAELRNCIVTGCRYGVLIDDISPTLRNCTLVSSSDFDLSLVHDTAVLINSCIIENFEVRDPASCLPIVSYTCLLNDFSAFPNNGNIGDDPQFLDSQGGVFLLKPSSPCVDKGDPDPEHNDLDGSRNDMGAFGSVSAGLISYTLMVTSVTSSPPGLSGYAVDNLIDGNIIVNGDFAVENKKKKVQIDFDLGSDRVINRIAHYNDSIYGAKKVMLSYASASSPDDFTNLQTSTPLKILDGYSSRNILSMEPVTARYFRFVYEEFNHPRWFQLNEIEFFGWGGRPGTEIVPIVTIESTMTPHPGYGTSRLKDGKAQYQADFAVNNKNGFFSLTCDLGSAKKVEKIIHYNDGEYGALQVKVYSGSSGFPIEWTSVATFDSLTIKPGKVSTDNLTFTPVTTRFFKLEYTRFNDPAWAQMNEIEFYGVSSSGPGTRLNGPGTPVTCSKATYPGYGTDKLQDGVKTFNKDFAVVGTGIEFVELLFKFDSDRNIEQIFLYNDGQYGARQVFLEYAEQVQPERFIAVNTWAGLPVVSGQITRCILTFPSLRGSRVRITLKDFGTPGLVQLNEIEIYGTVPASSSPGESKRVTVVSGEPFHLDRAVQARLSPVRSTFANCYADSTGVAPEHWVAPWAERERSGVLVWLAIGPSWTDTEAEACRRDVLKALGTTTLFAGASQSAAEAVVVSGDALVALASLCAGGFRHVVTVAPKGGCLEGLDILRWCVDSWKGHSAVLLAGPAIRGFASAFAASIPGVTDRPAVESAGPHPEREVSGTWAGVFLADSFSAPGRSSKITISVLAVKILRAISWGTFERMYNEHAVEASEILLNLAQEPRDHDYSGVIDRALMNRLFNTLSLIVDPSGSGEGSRDCGEIIAAMARWMVSGPDAEKSR